MAATLVKSVMLKIISDDGDTETKLARISEKADELARKRPELKIRIDAAAASAKMAVLRKELKDTGNQAKQTDRDFGGIGKSVASWAGISSGMKLFSGDATMAQRAMAGLSLATGLLEPLAAGAAAGVGAIGAAAVAGGLGIGIFGVVAKGVYAKVSTAVAAYTAAQLAAGKATTAAGKASALKAEQTAFDGLTGSQKKFATAIGAAKSQWNSFLNAASPGVISVMAGGLRLLPQALGLMKPFLASMVPALQMVTGELHNALSSEWVKKFASTMGTFSGPAFAGIAHIAGNIAKGIAGIVTAFVPMSGTVLGGLDKMTAKFAKWGQSLSGHSGFQSMMKEAKQYAGPIAASLKNIGDAAVHLVGDMSGTKSMVPVWASLLPPVTHFLDVLIKANPALVQLGLYALAASSSIKKMSGAFSGIKSGIGFVQGGVGAFRNLKGGISDAETAASDASGAWGTFGGKISSAVSAIGKWGIGSKIAAGATKVWTGVQAAFDVVMDANPIGLIVIGIAALIAVIVLCTIKFKGFRDFWKAAWKDIEAAAVGAWHFIDDQLIHPFMTGIDELVSFVKGHWKLLATIIGTLLLGPIAGIVIYVATHWQQIKDLTTRLVSDVRGILSWFGRLPGLFFGWWEDAVRAVDSAVGRLLSYVRAIPGRIVSGLGNLGHLLWGAGIQVMQGLIGGLESMVGTLVSKAASVGSSVLHGIEGALGISSPSKKAIAIMGWLASGLRIGLDGMRGSVAAGGSKVADAITAAIADGLLSKKAGAKLQSALVAQMKQARAYATSISSSAVSGYDITSMTTASGTSVTSASGILGGLKVDLGQIKAFTRNMKKLGREGLNKQLLRQLFAAGPIQGGPVAAALAAAGLGEIRAIDREESQIQSWSRKLGGVGAQSVYGGQAGVQRVLLDLKAGGGGNGLEQVFRSWLKASIREHGGDPNVIGR
jgi:hypothetical protein